MKANGRFVSKLARDRKRAFKADPGWRLGQALGLGNEDRVYAVLADREATVLRVEEGPATERSFEDILKACAGT